MEPSGAECASAQSVTFGGIVSIALLGPFFIYDFMEKTLSNLIQTTNTLIVAERERDAAFAENKRLKTENDHLRSALIAFYGAASTSPDMDGSSRLIGWNRVYLDKAYETAKRLLLPNVEGETRRQMARALRQQGS